MSSEHERTGSDPEGRADLAAIGLSYDPDGDSAPRVIAKGRGELAERLLSIAEENGVPIRSDPDLLQFLTATQIGDEVPEEVYAAVASLIAFLWRLNDGVEPG